MKLSFLFPLIFILSCTTKQKDKGISTTDTSKSVEKSILADSLSSNAEIIETFTDSVNIGNKGNCKIELIKHRVFDDVYVIVKFYTRESEYRNMQDNFFWKMQNTYFYECTDLMRFEPNISDFNNDKFNDITFISATAARVFSNQIRRLFIFDHKKKKLISIVNSEEYPNMLYNKELDCIDAFLVYGGSSTVFTRIKGDSLKEFARVDNSNYRTVSEINKYGKEKVLKEDSIVNDDDVYVRYINYKPLKRYKD